jgi:phage baseplate assembly protein gpV
MMVDGKSFHGHGRTIMWLMILIAVHINDPSDQPARMTLEFPDQHSCEYAKSTLTYTVKFKSFKIEALCQRKTT